MRLGKHDIDVRLISRPSRMQGVKNDVMTYGEDDQYPELIERLIKGSPTASGSAKWLASFLVGQGFEQSVNSQVVGIDSKGQSVTVLDILRHAAHSISYYNGYYLRVLHNEDMQPYSVVPLPFKYMRFSKPDDGGFSAFVWLNKKMQKVAPIKYGVYNPNPAAIVAQIEAGASGQAFFDFFDKEYFYPLSLFDPVYMDMDTEAQIAIYRNNELRNGFRPKTFIGYADPGTDEQRDMYDKTIVEMMGPDGNSVMTYSAEVGADGALREGIKITQTESSLEVDFSGAWEKAIESKIRRAAANIPQVLIDFEKGGLGNVSGEAFREAVSIYNAITRDMRAQLAQGLQKLLSRMPALSSFQDWTIKELEL